MVGHTSRHNGEEVSGRDAPRTAVDRQLPSGTIVESEIIERATRCIRLRGVGTVSTAPVDTADQAEMAA